MAGGLLPLPPPVLTSQWCTLRSVRMYPLPDMPPLRCRRAVSILQAAAEGTAQRSPGGVREAKTSSVDLIRLDVARTFPQLGLFQKVCHVPGASCGRVGGAVLSSHPLFCDDPRRVI